MPIDESNTNFNTVPEATPPAPGTPPSLGMQKKIEPKQVKLFLALAIIGFAVIVVVAWAFLRSRGVDDSPIVTAIPTGKKEVKEVIQNQRKEYEDKDLPPGIPGNLPRESEKAVIQNYQYVGPKGEKQSVREFTVEKNALDAITFYTDFSKY